MRKGPLRVTSVDFRELVTGVCLVILGFFMPLVLTVHNFQILTSLELALRRSELTELMVAALKLVGLNTLRGLPHYLGAFFIGESISFRWKGENAQWANAISIIFIICLTYLGIGLIHGIQYDFGLPAVLASGTIIIFERMDYRYIVSGKKTLQIMLVFTALQFMDIMPAFNGLPVGRGEASMDIKLAAAVLGGEAFLNAMGAGFLVLFMVFGILIFYQLKEENQLRELDRLREQNQAIRLRNEINEMKNRTYQEMQYLVHDLKSPLTSVQTLVGIIKLDSEAEQTEERTEYLTRIEQGIESMSEMISEILYEDKQSIVTTQKVLDTALAQMSITDYSPFIRVDNQIPEAKIQVNRVLFPRALVNLAQNSARALPQDREGYILLKVEREEGRGESWVSFSVSDNGKGIKEEDQSAVWESGMSYSNSSGIGLAFVKRVVENSDGRVELKSTWNKGTTITIYLQERGETA